MDTVLIAGGTGLIGRALTKMLLDQGYEVIVLSRNPASFKTSSGSKLTFASWNVKDQTIDEDSIRKADYVVHLAGANVGDKRWTKKRKREILESRTKSSELIVTALKTIPNKVSAVISASGIGWYTPSSVNPQEKRMVRIETDAPDTGFLGETCRLWEASIDPVTDLDKRLVKLRTGIVLSNEGGAFPKFKTPVRFGIAAILRGGAQMLSWIHIDDICRIYLEAIRNKNIVGVYNAVAPNPVNNKEFMLSLARKMKGNFFIPFYVPGFLLKLFLGEMSIEVLKSVEVSAEKIRSAGFQFAYPSLDSALQALTARNESQKKKGIQ